MRIDFNEMEERTMPGMNGGTGEMSAKLYMDAERKIIPCKLHPGGSIGPHRHETGDDINYILSGTGMAVCGGQQEPLSAGVCHICPRGAEHSIINTGADDLVMLTVVVEHEMEIKEIVLETDRLWLRKMVHSDFADLCKILQDEAVMYAYEGAFDDQMVLDWLNNQRRRYREEGVGLWAVILKGTGEFIGQCGLTYQDIPGRRVLEVGYLFQKAYWHQGYATEAARACKDYAFDVLEAEEVFSIIRDNNLASQNVALRNGMTRVGTMVKHYRGVEMPHYIFSVRNANQ